MFVNTIVSLWIRKFLVIFWIDEEIVASEEGFLSLGLIMEKRRKLWSMRGVIRRIKSIVEYRISRIFCKRSVSEIKTWSKILSRLVKFLPWDNEGWDKFERWPSLIDTTGPRGFWFFVCFCYFFLTNDGYSLPWKYSGIFAELKVY